MGTMALNEALYQLEDLTRESGNDLPATARAELEAIRKAATGLAQRTRAAVWDQDAWDDGLTLMESIAEETP